MLTVLQCDARVPAGQFGTLLHERGVTPEIVRLFAGEPLPSPKHSGAILLLGGYMGVGDDEEFPFLRPLRSFIAEVVQAERPLLGLCLGGQMLAAALGGAIAPGSCGEKGVHTVTLTASGRRDPLFAGLPESFPVFQWHNDSFAIPPGALHLASSLACPGQAFRYGRAYGLQFHPEVNCDIVAAWSAATGEKEVILRDFAAAQVNGAGMVTAILDNFLQLALSE